VWITGRLVSWNIGDYLIARTAPVTARFMGRKEEREPKPRDALRHASIIRPSPPGRQDSKRTSRDFSPASR